MCFPTKRDNNYVGKSQNWEMKFCQKCDISGLLSLKLTLFDKTELYYQGKIKQQ